MNAVYVIGCSIGGAALGGFVGLAAGELFDGGCSDVEALISGTIGLTIGGFLGVVAGALAFVH